MKEKEKNKTSWEPVNKSTPDWKPLSDLTSSERGKYKNLFVNTNPGPKPTTINKNKTKPRKVRRHFKKGKK